MTKGFKPIISDTPKIMILGSMPSVTSLEKQEYYGFAHNRFWKIMQLYYDVTLNSYEDKVQLIKDNHFILWDVIGECDRVGSLDSAIKNVKVNDLDILINQYPSIQKIICNGKKSYTLFMKYFKHISEHIEVCYLPSTSNANQSLKQDELFELWFDALSK